jgi:hypothetical protein
MTGRFSLLCLAAVQTLTVRQSPLCGPGVKPGEKPQQLGPKEVVSRGVVHGWGKRGADQRRGPIGGAA